MEERLGCLELDTFGQYPYESGFATKSNSLIALARSNGSAFSAPSAGSSGSLNQAESKPMNPVSEGRANKNVISRGRASGPYPSGLGSTVRAEALFSIEKFFIVTRSINPRARPGVATE